MSSNWTRSKTACKPTSRNLSMVIQQKESGGGYRQQMEQRRKKESWSQFSLTHNEPPLFQNVSTCAARALQACHPTLHGLCSRSDAETNDLFTVIHVERCSSVHGPLLNNVVVVVKGPILLLHTLLLPVIIVFLVHVAPCHGCPVPRKACAILCSHDLLH